MIDNTFVITALRHEYVCRCIETLYEYTPQINFKVILVDMTKDGLPDIDGVHLKIRSYRNLGFAKAMNEGMIHGLHWESKYITCWNDDIECINDKWWDGIQETFKMPSEKEIIAVNPESVRIPMWGYGIDPSKYVEILSYKEDYTDKDYQFLLDGNFTHLEEKYEWLPDSFPRNYQGVCDGVAAWGTVFKSDKLEEIGLWDERFYPGGAEDYDMMARIYSRRYRAVSTRDSWVFHWWGKSKDEQHEIEKQGMPIEDKRRWADLSYLWPPELNEGNDLDIWGFYDGKDGTRKPYKRKDGVQTVEI